LPPPLVDKHIVANTPLCTSKKTLKGRLTTSAEIAKPGVTPQHPSVLIPLAINIHPPLAAVTVLPTTREHH